MVGPPAAVPLAQLRPGQSGVVQGVKGGFGMVRRLAALGIVPGTRVTVLSNSFRGPLIVEARGSRLALGRGEAMRVVVTPAAKG